VAESRFLHRPPGRASGRSSRPSPCFGNKSGGGGQWENRIAGVAALYFPEFPRVFKSWRGKAALWVLDYVPVPAEVRAQGPEVLAAGMLDATHHRVGCKRAQTLTAAAQISVAVTAGGPVSTPELSDGVAARGGHAARDGSRPGPVPGRDPGHSAAPDDSGVGAGDYGHGARGTRRRGAVSRSPGAPEARRVEPDRREFGPASWVDTD